MNKEEPVYTITPKGVIAIGLDSKEVDLIEKVYTTLYEHMTKFNRAIIPIDGKLSFVTFEKTKVSKFKQWLNDILYRK